ncbi:MAG: ArsI/CadI family heavy metal resistance metalloenzyme [Myxococcota bacterium]
MRLQLALNVSDLEAAIEFYRKLFATEVHKRKPGYANFEVESPPLKLVLFENKTADESLNHLGVEVPEEADLDAAVTRVQEAGLAHRVEEDTTCCYARAGKVWTQSPDGLAWEWYRIREHSESFGGFDPNELQTVERCC